LLFCAIQNNPLHAAVFDIIVSPLVILAAARPGTPACRPFPLPAHVHDTALLEAAKVGDAGATTSLVAEDADVDFPPDIEDPYDMPVHLAAQRNHAEALRVLVKAGASVFSTRG